MKTLLTLILGAIIWQTIITIIYYATDESEYKTIPCAMGVHFLILLGLSCLGRYIYKWYCRTHYTTCTMFYAGVADNVRFIRNELLPLFNTKEEEEPDSKEFYIIPRHACRSMPLNYKITKKNLQEWEDFLKKPLDK